METLNKKYDLKITVLSPLHIGAGAEKDWIEGADFVQKDNKVYKLNIKKVAKELGAETIADFLLKRDSHGLANKLPGKIDDYSDHMFSMKYRSINPIKTFIKEGMSDRPYVPGSSIKGAIRSILFTYLRDNEKDDRDVFGTPNKGDEFMRFVKFSDAKINDNTELINTKIFNLFGNDFNAGGWKHKGGKFGKTDSQFRPNGFNTIYEILKPKTSGFLSLAISPLAYHKIKVHSKKEKKDQIMSKDISFLFSIINAHTRKYLLKQIEFFNEFSNNETEKIIAHLNELLDLIPADNSSCIFKMAAGSGYHSITGDWLHEKDFINTGTWPRGIHAGKKKAKSRKIAVENDDFSLMGFVELKILTEEEKKQIQQQEEQRKAEIIQQAEEARMEKERIQREKQEEKEKLRAEKEAEEKAKKDEEERVARELKEIEEKKKKEKEEIKEREKLNLANKEAEKENAIKEGLASKLANINEYESGEIIIREYKRIVETIPESDYKSIEDFLFRSLDLKSLSNKQKKKWNNFKKGNWGLIKSWVDEKKAKEWFDKLNA
ncbi:MAG: type III-A CRISPR-associated RAMP protein Csm5 [Bacteroidota bacterium]